MVMGFAASPSETTTNGHVVALPPEISVQDPGDDPGMTRRQPGISAELPMSPQSVGVQDQQGTREPGIDELLHFPDGVADRAVMGDHARALGITGRKNDAGDVTDPREPHLSTVGLERGDRHRGTAGFP